MLEAVRKKILACGKLCHCFEVLCSGGSRCFGFFGASRVVFVLLRFFIAVFFGFLVETHISGGHSLKAKGTITGDTIAPSLLIV